jgi:cytochrome c556
MKLASIVSALSVAMLLAGAERAQAEGTNGPAQQVPLQSAQNPATKVPSVTFQAAPIIINGQGDDEAALFALPKDATPTLVKQKTDIETLRAKLKAERAKLIELVKTFDFDTPSANSAALAAAIERCKDEVSELEDLEAKFVLDRDLHVADVTKPAQSGAH